MAALRQGRQEMLATLYDAYSPVMFGVIRRIVTNEDVAEEVLKETFVAIWQRIGVYNASKERLLTWGLAIARGLALEAVKTDRYAALLQANNSAPKATELQNKKVPLPHAENTNPLVQHLTPLEKQALELLYLKGRSCAETAAELNVSDAQLREILKKACSTLKAEKSV